jgi:hypothetical protein
MHIIADDAHVKAQPCCGTFPAMLEDGRRGVGPPAKTRPRVGLKRRARTCPGQFEKVLQDLMSPLFKPAVSHCWRIAEEPWVKLSGTA